MGASLFFQFIINIVSIGLGCGTCCSPYMSVFLSAYTMSHAQSIKKAFKIFIKFFLGKLSAVELVCILTSLLGKQWITKDGYIGNFNLNKAVEAGLLVIGIILLCSWFYKSKRNSKTKCRCSACTPKTYSGWSTYGVGFIFGITPCAPMLLLIGYTLMLPLWEAVILALAFTVSSSLSPMLFIVFIGGVLSQKMYEEIPKLVAWVRLFCYILFIITAVIMLIEN
jgi:hypothetical protein